MEAVEDGGTRLMYSAQNRTTLRCERSYVRYKDTGRVRILSRRRFV